MNLFAPTTGGHPLYLDDLILLQNAYAQVFQGIVGYLNPTGNTILTGVVINTSGPTVTYTSGFVAIAGEIFYIPAGSFTNSFNPVSQLYFMPVQTVLPPSPDTYEDDALVNVHFQRQAVLKYYNSATDSGGAFYPLMCRAGAGIISDWIPPAGTSVSDFFDPTGLGINGMLGYGMCNGVAGRPDLRGWITACATNVPNSGAPTLSSALGGTTNNVGDAAGTVIKTLNQGNLPNVNLPVTDPGHQQLTHGGGAIWDDASHPSPSWYLSISNGSYSGPGGNLFGRDSVPDSNMLTGVGYTGISVNTGGSGTGFDGRQPTYYVYKIVKLN